MLIKYQKKKKFIKIKYHVYLKIVKQTILMIIINLQIFTLLKIKYLGTPKRIAESYNFNNIQGQIQRMKTKIYENNDKIYLLTEFTVKHN